MNDSCKELRLTGANLCDADAGYHDFQFVCIGVVRDSGSMATSTESTMRPTSCTIQTTNQATSSLNSFHALTFAEESQFSCMVKLFMY